MNEVSRGTEDVTASLCVSVLDRITPQLISSYADWFFFFSYLGLMYSDVPADVFRCKNQIGGFY